MYDTTQLTKAFEVVEAYETGLRKDYKEATKIFEGIGKSLSSDCLAAMQEVYYSLLDKALRLEYEHISAIAAVISSAWDGIGEWRY